LISHEDMMKLWEEVKANHKRLDACVGPHDFVEASRAHDYTGPKVKFRCLKCNGVVDNNSHHWYKLGLKHGGRG
jgi:hypothetical protein